MTVDDRAGGTGLNAPEDCPEDCANHLLATLEGEGAITATGRTMIGRFMRRWGVSAFHALLMTELLSEAELANALGKSLGLPRLYQLHTLAFADEALAAVDFRRARAWECLPVRGATCDGGRLELVIADPTRQDRIAVIKAALTHEIRVAVGERTEVLRAVDELYPLSSQLPNLYGKLRL
jgi:hypothetical protein